MTCGVNMSEYVNVMHNELTNMQVLKTTFDIGKKYVRFLHMYIENMGIDEISSFLWLIHVLMSEIMDPINLMGSWNPVDSHILRLYFFMKEIILYFYAWMHIANKWIILVKIDQNE